MSAPQRLKIQNPTDGAVIAELDVAGPKAVSQAVAEARLAQEAWAACSTRERVRSIKAARRELVRARREILDLLQRETGKARFDVVGELMGTCVSIGHLLRHAVKWLGAERVSAFPLFGKKARVVYQARGVVGVISPWNSPLHLSLSDAIPALLAGNAVVIKPSELTPLAVSAAVQAMNRVLPPNLLQVAIGAGATGEALVEQVDMVCVTGSTRTGMRVAEQASRRLVPVLLELGGNDPMIVHRDADLERAARAAAWGGCFMTGQVCMSVERIFVEAPVAEDFVARLVEQVEKLRFGPEGGEIDYGPFISPVQLDVVERHIADAVSKGATVLTGGSVRREHGGIFFPPTVITKVTADMEIMREETFGPVLPVQAVQNIDEAVACANDIGYGLNASVWTRNLEQGLETAQRIESGNVCINECVISAGVPGLPFGGMKLSGLGQRHGGAAGLRQFCHAKAILIEARSRRDELTWFPYSDRRAAWLERLIGLLFR